jgi:hypothetical protein
MGTFLILLGIFIWPFLRSFKNIHPEFLAIFLGTFCLYEYILFISPEIPVQNTKSLARFAQESLPKDTEILLVRTYPQDFPVYLNKKYPIPVVEWKGELAFGTIQEDTSSWILTWEDFLKKWSAPKLTCAIVKKDFYEKLMHQSFVAHQPSTSHNAESPNHVLICNQEEL